MAKRAGLKGCTWFWGRSECLQGSGLPVVGGAGGTRCLLLPHPPSPQADPPCLNTQERKNNRADGVLDILLMEIPLPLLLFAACGNCAEPQRQEPKRVSCIIPSASLHRRAVCLVQTSCCKQKFSPSCSWPGPGAWRCTCPGFGSLSGSVPGRRGCWPGAHPCLFLRFTIQ